VQRLPVHSPVPRFGQTLAYDGARNRAVLFTGVDTWVFLP
jgi:hypothetical protein